VPFAADQVGDVVEQRFAGTGQETGRSTATVGLIWFLG